MNKNTNTGQPNFSAGRPCRLIAASLIAILTGCATPQAREQLARPALVRAPPATVAGQVAPPRPAPPATPPLPAQAPMPADGTGQDQAEILRAWVAQEGRLYRVAAPLLIDNTELCPRHARNLLGFTAKNRYSYSAAFADAAQSALGLDERLHVMGVLPGSGAELADLEKGDILLAVEIEPLPQGPDAERAGAAVIAAELQGRSSVSLTILRGGARMGMDIPLTPACAMVIELGNTDSAGSFADGQRVMVTRGMLELARSDDELAAVLAQEIARNILAPQPIQQIAAWIDRLHTLTPPTAEASEADGAPPNAADNAPSARKLALYLLARAGYDIGTATAFWQQQANPAVTPEEMAVLLGTASRIRTRRQAGQALVPDAP